MNYLIFRGAATSTPNNVIPAALVSTQLSDTYVGKMPAKKKAGMRFSEYYVKGRDGALHVDEGYSNFDMTVALQLINATVDKKYAVNAWADGTGKLISSDDVYYVGNTLVAKAYRASVKGEVKWSRVEGNGKFYDRADITFNCQPFMFEAIDSQVTLTSSGSLLNPGSAISYPLIQVNGSGDAVFAVNGSEIQIDDMTANVPVYIDCETGYVYTESGATSIRGEIPYFDYGTNSTNTVTVGANVSSLVITPRWRWI